MKKRFIIDIDGTICETNGNDYTNSKPLFHRIEKINYLHKQGYEIVFWTSRGMRSFNGDKDRCYVKYYELTKRQLDEWGVLYDQLWLGKPTYDIWIDDKAWTDMVLSALNAEDFLIGAIEDK